MAQQRVTYKRVLESIAQVNDSLQEFKQVVDSPRDGHKLIPENAVLKRVPFGKTTLWDMIKKGRFPAPRRVTAHRKGWVDSEVDDWVISRPVVEQYADDKAA